VAALAVAVAGACLLVDTRAESAFDAPKRLVTLLGIAVAVVALLVLPGPARGSGWSWRTGTTEQRLALVLIAGALAIAVVSAIVSPRRVSSLASTRTLWLFALLLPLGASRALDGGRPFIVIGAFVGACAVNASVSLLQFFGGLRLFSVEAVGGRLDVSAFVGNDGVLALSLALACLICLAAVVWARSPAIRLAGGGGIVLHLAALAVNQSLTALTALAAGSVVLVAMSLRRRSVIGALAVGVVLATGVMLHPTLSRRAQSALELIRAGDWDAALTYRSGPWAAALEMTRARPLVGWGPGTFAAEFVPHRLQAELRFQRRFVNPFLAGSYTEAHSEYLQAAAEGGIPAGLAALAAIGALIVGLVRVIRSAPDGPSRREAIVLLTVLCAGGVSALTWFPLQRPITAVLLLLAAGRAWRLSGRAAAAEDFEERHGFAGARRGSGGLGAISGPPSKSIGPVARPPILVILAVLIVAALVPELSRYAAERRLYQASAILRSVFARPHELANSGGVVAWAASTASAVAADLPGDWRPLNLAGSAWLLARRADLALDRYREALALGERPEIDANVGRAYASLGRHDRAAAAFLRAGWISPAVLSSLPRPSRDALRSELAALEQKLLTGRLGAPPPSVP